MLRFGIADQLEIAEVRIGSSDDDGYRSISGEQRLALLDGLDSCPDARRSR